MVHHVREDEEDLCFESPKAQAALMEQYQDSKS